MSTVSATRPIEAGRDTDRALQLTNVGATVLRYGLALVLLWIGFLKFQPYEAMAIMPLIAHSPFMAWTLTTFGLGTTAHLLGTYEIVAAILISLRPVSARLSVIGGALASLTFAATLSFLFTTPAAAVFAPAYSFPFFSMVGQFLIKDIVLLGAALYVAGESWSAAVKRTSHDGRN